MWCAQAATEEKIRVDAIIAQQKAAGIYKKKGVPTPANRPDRCGSTGAWQHMCMAVHGSGSERRQQATAPCVGYSSSCRTSAALHAAGPGLQLQALHRRLPADWG